MSPATGGLHHVTAIAGDPERNAHFYARTLGLRFVKRTVNHDDPGTYHFYFGDRVGTPGTTITFFPWTGSGRRGRFGAGQTRDVAYQIPPDAVEYWADRLEARSIDVERRERFGERVLRFDDPDGIGLELVASDRPSDAQAWEDGPVPADRQLRGFHGVTLDVERTGPTASVLTDVFGYEPVDETDGRQRYRARGDGGASLVDLVETDAGRGRMGVGTVHHVAFRADDGAQQEQFREALADGDLSATRVIDRVYFQSVYAREPGGVLFEVATTGPGFTVDEGVDELGSRLTLPPWLEDERAAIEVALPTLDLSDLPPGAPVR